MKYPKTKLEKEIRMLSVVLIACQILAPIFAIAAIVLWSIALNK